MFKVRGQGLCILFSSPIPRNPFRGLSHYPVSVFFSHMNAKEPSLAGRIVDSGLTFLRAYAKLASLAYHQHLYLFVFRPKLHYFHHLLLEISCALNSGGLPLNPLAYSCSAAEDFIGRASLLSRRTAAATTERRVLQRYLAGAADVWAREAH